MSVLRTDKYKLVMAQTGFALRPETFVFMLRKGGPFFLPYDLEAYVKACLPKICGSDLEYLSKHGLHMDGAYRRAMAASVEVIGLPKGSWFSDRVPVLTITGPSALVSHLEAQIIWLQFGIQVATLAKKKPGALKHRLGVVTCMQEKELVLQALDGAGVAPDFDIEVQEDAYYQFVFDRASALLQTVGSADRVLEAGMRAASCMEQHEIVLRACKDAGFKATSNVYLAHKLGMTPAGTTGHEHTQRWGDDYSAFTAVRDRFPGNVTYLLDTYSTLGSGLPNAIKVLSENPMRSGSIRFDSEATLLNDYHQAVSKLHDLGLDPGLSLGGGFDQVQTERFEALATQLGWPKEKQTYMYGQYLVQPHVPLPTRGAVGAVYKLSRSADRPTMKFSDTAGKSSIPGNPVFWVAKSGETPLPNLIGQQGEEIPQTHRQVSGSDLPSAKSSAQLKVSHSSETLSLMGKLTNERKNMSLESDV